MINEKTLSATEAGEFLHVLIPSRTADQWTNWLGNNRDLNRETPHRVPFGRVGKSVTYDGDDLMKAATILADSPWMPKTRNRKPKDQPAPVVAVEAPVGSTRPGLELALKIITSELPEGVSAENAIRIALSCVPQ